MAVEHAMFNFEGLKVNSHYDRQTDRQNDNQSTLLLPPTLKRCETNNFKNFTLHVDGNHKQHYANSNNVVMAIACKTNTAG